MNAYPIQQFIDSRCAELNISHRELIARTAFSNVSVGLKRLQQLFTADFRAADGLIKKLPAALAVSPEVINQAISDTNEKLKLDADDSYRASFVPHFIIRTANRGRPKHIFFAGLLNASQYVRDNFPLDISTQDYVKHALAHLKTHLNSIDNFYYAPVDIVINYAYDKAEVVSLSGQHISYLDKSVPNGTLTIQLK